jgi:hypothetical protein
MMKAVRLIFIVQIMAGCIAAFFAFAAGHGASHHYVLASAYEQKFRESGTPAGESKIYGMTPTDFTSFATAVARDGLGASEALMFGGLIVADFGIAGLILIRRASINSVQPTRASVRG